MDHPASLQWPLYDTYKRSIWWPNTKVNSQKGKEVALSTKPTRHDAKLIVSQYSWVPHRRGAWKNPQNPISGGGLGNNKNFAEKAIYGYITNLYQSDTTKPTERNNTELYNTCDQSTLLTTLSTCRPKYLLSKLPWSRSYFQKLIGEGLE